jgi:hypothetical protein
MSAQKLLRLLHICGTAWFILASAYVLVLGLRQVGFEWWLIVSLSGNGAAIAFLLVSAYLHAIFRNKSRDDIPAIEHPLTSTSQYATLYSLIPFLGTIAGLSCIIDADTVQQVLVAIATGTIGATFGFWIIADPAISFAERWLPASRKHRLMRHAIAKALYEQKQREHKQLLANLEEQERSCHQQWEEVLLMEAQKLAALISQAVNGDTSAEFAVIESGLIAWRRGGQSCMKQLHEMASDICRRNGHGLGDEYISTWWDGIGQWHHNSLT